MLARGQDVPPAVEDNLVVLRLGGAAAAFVSWAIMITVFAGLVTLFLAFLIGHEGTYRSISPSWPTPI